MSDTQHDQEQEQNGARRVVEGEVVGNGNADELGKASVRELPATLRGFGDRGEIAAMRQRMMHMVKDIEKAPPHVVYAVAQMSVAYGLNPLNGEIYLANFGSDNKPNWTPVIGIAGLRKKAREQANFVTKSRTMTAEEVQRYRADMHRPEDVGVEVELYRLDAAAQCNLLGIPYEPVRGIGFWRKCAYIKDEWVNGRKTGEKVEVEDNLPATWTREQVAEKRAETSAIRKAYSLRFGTVVVEGAMPDENEVFIEVGRMIAAHDRDNAPMAEPKLRREEDGEILWAS